jgi:hypothetical protein
MLCKPSWFRRFVSGALLVFAGSATLPGCVFELPKGTDPLVANVTGGDGQYAPQGIELVQPVSIQVAGGKDGTPASGVAVDFSPSHGGRVDSPTVLTDSAGQASVRWTLGQELGEQQLEVLVDGRVLAVVRSTALERWPARALYILQGALQSHYVSQCYPPDVLVLVTNGWGTPLSGVSVTFEPTPDGAATPSPAVSDAQGLARTHWEVPQTPGDHRLIARVTDPMGVAPNLEAIALTTCVPLFVPPTVTVLSGAGQTVLQHTMMPEPIVLQVLDPNGNPAAGYSVTFSLRQAGTNPVVGTDAEGIVRWAGYVHEAGPVEIVASVEPSYGTRVTIPLQVLPHGGLYDGRYGAALINPGAQELRYLMSFSVRDGAVSDVDCGGGFPSGCRVVSSRVSEVDAAFELVLEYNSQGHTYLQGRLQFRPDGAAAVFGHVSGPWLPGWMFDAGRI